MLLTVVESQILECRYYRPDNFDAESISTLRDEIWALVSEHLRQSTSPNSFKQGIKKVEPK